MIYCLSYVYPQVLHIKFRLSVYSGIFFPDLFDGIFDDIVAESPAAQMLSEPATEHLIVRRGNAAGFTDCRPVGAFIIIYLADNLVIVRLQGVLTQAELKLVGASEPAKGRDLIKRVRTELIEAGRPLLEEAIEGITGSRVESVHTDISTVTANVLSAAAGWVRFAVTNRHLRQWGDAVGASTCRSCVWRRSYRVGLCGKYLRLCGGRILTRSQPMM